MQCLKLGHSTGNYKDTGGNMGQIQKAGEQRFRTIGGRRDGEKEMENKMKVQREKTGRRVVRRRMMRGE